MTEDRVIVEALALHDKAGEYLLSQHPLARARAKAAVLDALRLLTDVEAVREDAEELIRELEPLDPRALTVTELDRYRWRLHRIIEKAVERLFASRNMRNSVAVIDVDGWHDPKLESAMEEFFAMKRKMESAGLVEFDDVNRTAYLVGKTLFLRIGSARDHISRIERSAGGYKIRYYDSDENVNAVLARILEALGGRVTVRDGGVEAEVPGDALVPAVRALALMTSEDFRQRAVGNTLAIADAYITATVTGDVDALTEAYTDALARRYESYARRVARGEDVDIPIEATSVSAMLHAVATTKMLSRPERDAGLRIAKLAVAQQVLSKANCYSEERCENALRTLRNKVAEYAVALIEQERDAKTKAQLYSMAWDAGDDAVREKILDKVMEALESETDAEQLAATLACCPASSYLHMLDSLTEERIKELYDMLGREYRMFSKYMYDSEYMELLLALEDRVKTKKKRTATI